MKKILQTLLALLLLVTVALPFQQAEASSQFTDVTLYEKEINYLANRGIIKGYDDGTFKPEASIKRIQAVQMLLRAKGITDFTAPDPNFADLKKGDYGYAEVAKAVQLGFISGKVDPQTGEKYFNPWDTLTRGQMAKLLSLAYNLKGTTLSEFYDVPSTDSFYSYVNALAYNNITTGYSDNTFRPYQSISRQHFSVFLARTLEPSFRDSGANRTVTGGLKLNTRKTYVYNYPNPTYSYTEKLNYTGTSSGKDRWTGVDSDNVVTHYTYSETTSKFMFDVEDYDFSSTVPYPLTLNKMWTDDSTLIPINYKVTSMNKTVTTPAGTFKNAIEIKNDLGVYDYYVQGIGLVLETESSIDDKDVLRVQELQKIY